MRQYTSREFIKIVEFNSFYYSRHNGDHAIYVNHKDENIRNNNVGNLEWCTNAYNLAYSVGKTVEQYSKEGTLIKVFNTIADASKELKIPTTNVSKCCKGLRKSAGNFVWKYGQL